MGITYINSADVGNTSRFDYTSNLSISSDQARTGTYSFKSNTNGSTGGWFVPSSQSHYARIALYMNSSYFQNYLWIKDGDNEQLTIQVSPPDGIVRVKRGDQNGTIIATGGSPKSYVWTVYEVYYYIDNTSGAVQVKENGIQIINLSSADTQATANATANRLDWRYDGAYNYGYFDDILCRDDTWPGLGGVHVLLPSATGATTQWTASAGNDYECVNEAPPDFTDYLYTDTGNSNYVHLLNFADLPSGVVSVTGVGTGFIGRVSDVGGATVRSKLYHSGSTTNGSNNAIDVSEEWTNMYATDVPGGTGFTVAQVNALQCGIENI